MPFCLWIHQWRGALPLWTSFFLLGCLGENEGLGWGEEREREMLFALAKCPLAFPSSFTTSLPLAISLIPAVDAVFVCLPVAVHSLWARTLPWGLPASRSCHFFFSVKEISWTNTLNTLLPFYAFHFVDHPTVSAKLNGLSRLWQFYGYLVFFSVFIGALHTTCLSVLYSFLKTNISFKLYSLISSRYWISLLIVAICSLQWSLTLSSSVKVICSQHSHLVFNLGLRLGSKFLPLTQLQRPFIAQKNRLL